MKHTNPNLLIRHLDNKIKSNLSGVPGIPDSGWIHTIRTTLKMSLRQLANKMSMTPQSVRDIEIREKEGTVTLNTLKDAANALDMQLVFYFLPKDGSIEKLVERKAYEMALKIVSRTSASMKLENQENSDERIKEAIKELTYDIKKEMPKTLWD